MHKETENIGKVVKLWLDKYDSKENTRETTESMLTGYVVGLTDRYKFQVDEVKNLIQQWTDKQGHDRCWYYPELFSQLEKLFGIVPTVAACLPPKEEFKKGCEIFCNQQYGNDDIILLKGIK